MNEQIKALKKLGLSDDEVVDVMESDKRIDNGEDIKLRDVEIIEEIQKEKQKQYILELMSEYITNYDSDFYINKLVKNHVMKLRKAAITDEDFKRVKDFEQKYFINM